MESQSMEQGGSRPPAEAGTARDVDRALLVVALLGGFAIRLLPAWRAVLSESVAQFLGTDAYYHVRRIQYAVRRFPTILDTDPYVNFPEGARIIWPGGFDLLLAVVSKLLLHPASPAGVDRLSALAIPFLGVAVIGAVYALGRATLPRPGGGVAALTFAFLPYPVTYSLLGYVDHHVMEPLFLAAAAAFLAGGWSRRGPAAAAWGAAAGALASLSFLFVTIGAVIVGLVCALAAWEAIRGRFEGSRAAGLGALAAATLTLLLLARASPWGQDGGMTSLVLSSLQAHLAVAGAGLALALIAGAWRGIGWRRRALGAVAGVALAAAALLHGGPALIEPLRESARFVGRAEGLEQTIGESTPLWELAPMKIVLRLTPLGTLLPLVLVVAAIRDRRRPSGSAALLAAAVLALGVAQIRFMVIGGVGLAYAAGWLGSVAWHGASRRARPWRIRAAALGALLLGVVPASVLFFVRYPDATHFEPRPEDAALAAALRARRQIEGGLEQVRPRLEWGVAARWELGHLLIYRGEAPVVACPFGLAPWHVEGVERVAKLFLSDSDAAARDLCHRLRVRYVATSNPFTQIVADAITTGAPPGRYYVAASSGPKGQFDTTVNFLRTAAFRLHVADGSFVALSSVSLPAMPSFRLVWESEERLPVVTLAGLPPGHRPSIDKLFEVVEGARVAGSCRPGEPVGLAVPVHTNRGRRFDWRNQVPCGATGRFEIRTPHASPAVKVDQGGSEKTIPITEAQVLAGQAITVDLR